MGGSEFASPAHVQGQQGLEVPKEGEAVGTNLEMSRMGEGGVGNESTERLSA